MALLMDGQHFHQVWGLLSYGILHNSALSSETNDLETLTSDFNLKWYHQLRVTCRNVEQISVFLQTSILELQTHSQVDVVFMGLTTDFANNFEN